LSEEELQNGIGRHLISARNEFNLGVMKIGGRDRDRTGDPLLAKQVLSQLSYTPTAETMIHFNAFVRLRHTNSH
jgi:hypothetical protein